jgi:hypothetical protein
MKAIIYISEPEVMLAAHCISTLHFHVHKSPLLFPILNQINRVHITPSNLSKIHFIVILSSKSMPC